MGEAVKGAIEEESGHSWAREVARRADLGQYEKLQTELDLATYIKKGTGRKLGEQSRNELTEVITGVSRFVSVVVVRICE